MPRTKSFLSKLNPLSSKEDRISRRPTVKAGDGNKAPNVHEYEYVMVFESDPKTGEPLYPDKFAMMKILTSKGLDLYAYINYKRDKIIVLIRMPLDKLRLYAEEKGVKMKLDPEKLRKIAEAGNEEAQIKPLNLTQGDPSYYEPYENIYAPYRNELEHLYWKELGKPDPFREVIRLQMIKRLIEERPDNGGEGFKIRRYLKNGSIQAFFPLHDDPKVLDHIEHRWVSIKSIHDVFKDPPYHVIREYFGEKIGLFFMFEKHYGSWLIYPAVVGLPMQIAVWYTGNYDLDALPALAFFTALWAVFLTEFWKRKEATKALEWGTYGIEDNEPDRPDFKGSMQPSPIDGKMIKIFPNSRFVFNMSISLSVVFLLAASAVGVVIGIYIMRASLRKELGDNVQLLASILNTLQIQFFDFVFNTWLAYVLTDFENHRTDTQYQDSILAKLFAFQFVNAYSSFFYLAFVANSQPVPDGANDDAVGECGGPTCMAPLSTNLAIIFGSRLATAAATKVLMPMILKKLADRNKGQDDPDTEEDEEVLEAKKTEPEKQMELAPYDPLIVNIQSYMELAIQFGYVALFVTALPIAPFFAYISVLFDLRASAFQLLKSYQRPEAQAAEDIGAWQTIFEVIGGASILTNAGIMIFTMTTFNSYSTEGRFFMFIGFQWVCIGLQVLIAAAIPDIPEKVTVQLKRTDLLVSKCIEVDPDKDELADEHPQDLKVNDYPF